MKPMKAACIALVALGVLAAAAPASAHRTRTHVHFGVHFGTPVWWYHPYPYYYYPPYYSPPVVYYPVPAEPTRYIERGDAYNPPDERPGYWYYCPEEKKYYPYVKQCPGGWQKVTPKPPGE